MDNTPSPNTSGGRLRDLQGIAEYTGLPIGHIRHLVRNKAIPFVKFSGRLWFDCIEIDKWIRRNTVQPGQAA